MTYVCTALDVGNSASLADTAVFNLPEKAVRSLLVVDISAAFFLERAYNVPVADASSVSFPTFPSSAVMEPLFASTPAALVDMRPSCAAVVVLRSATSLRSPSSADAPTRALSSLTLRTSPELSLPTVVSSALNLLESALVSPPCASSTHAVDDPTYKDPVWYVFVASVPAKYTSLPCVAVAGIVVTLSMTTFFISLL